MQTEYTQSLQPAPVKASTRVYYGLATLGMATVSGIYSALLTIFYHGVTLEFTREMDRDWPSASTRFGTRSTTRFLARSRIKPAQNWAGGSHTCDTRRHFLRLLSA